LDLLAHELVDPVELLLELGLGLEVPCHGVRPPVRSIVPRHENGVPAVEHIVPPITSRSGPPATGALTCGLLAASPWVRSTTSSSGRCPIRAPPRAKPSFASRWRASTSPTRC